MHACQDALVTVFSGHMVAAACKELDITGIIYMDKQLCIMVMSILIIEPDEAREVDHTTLKDVARKVVKKFTVITEAVVGKEVFDSHDGVYSYARVLCHFASLVLLFIDAWKEGDGNRVFRYWKILMLHFRAEHKTKYALESLRLQFQVATLPPYLSHQVIWGRFISSRGGKGNNVPCDLHNEHVNRAFKDIIRNMGANFTKEALTWAARSVSSLEKATRLFDKETSLHPEAVAHSTRSNDKDVLIVVKVLLKSRVLEIIEDREHRMFPNFPIDPLDKLDRVKMETWIKRKAKEYMKSNAIDSDMEVNSQPELPSSSDRILRKRSANGTKQPDLEIDMEFEEDEYVQCNSEFEDDYCDEYVPCTSESDFESYY